MSDKGLPQSIEMHAAKKCQNVGFPRNDRWKVEVKGILGEYMCIFLHVQNGQKQQYIKGNNNNNTSSKTCLVMLCVVLLSFLIIPSPNDLAARVPVFYCLLVAEVAGLDWLVFSLTPLY